jgi:translation initiation factor eIF-2B subunit delta
VKKKLTKAERRELQERQRAAKAAKSSENLKTPKKPLSPMNPPTTPKTPHDMRADDRRSKKAKAGGITRTVAKKPVALFSHLMQWEKLDHLALEKNIHPIVQSLGLQFSEFLIAGGNARYYL